MFSQISRTGVGIYAYLMLSIVQALGFDMTETQIEEFLVACITVASFILAMYGQWKRDDLDGGLWRKP